MSMMSMAEGWMVEGWMIVPVFSGFLVFRSPAAQNALARAQSPAFRRTLTFEQSRLVPAQQSRVKSCAFSAAQAIHSAIFKHKLMARSKNRPDTVQQTRFRMSLSISFRFAEWAALDVTGSEEEM